MSPLSKCARPGQPAWANQVPSADAGPLAGLALAVALLFAIFMAGPVAAQNLALTEAVALALDATPALARAEAQASAAASIPPQAGSLPDPRLNLGLVNVPVDSWALDQDPMSQQQIGFSQDFPFPGKLDLRREAALADAEAQRFAAMEFRLQLIRRVKEHWWQLLYLDRALELLARNEALFRQRVETAQTQYSVGRGQQQDILLAQLELNRLADERLQLLARRQQAQAWLNTLMNRPAATAITLSPLRQATLPVIASEEEWLARAMAQRPKVRVEEKRLEAAHKRQALAQRDSLPDFRLSANYGRRDIRSDIASLQFSLSLPLYAGSKQKNAVDQHRALAQASRHELADTRARIKGEIVATLARFTQAREQLQLLGEKIIPQARQTVEAMLAGYQVGRVDFLGLVRAQTTLYQHESQYWRAYTLAQQSLAQLEAMAGEEHTNE